jgi:hypothetical protein
MNGQTGAMAAQRAAAQRAAEFRPAGSATPPFCS